MCSGKILRAFSFVPKHTEAAENNARQPLILKISRKVQKYDIFISEAIDLTKIISLEGGLRIILHLVFLDMK